MAGAELKSIFTQPLVVHNVEDRAGTRGWHVRISILVLCVVQVEIVGN